MDWLKKKIAEVSCEVRTNGFIIHIVMTIRSKPMFQKVRICDRISIGDSPKIDIEYTYKLLLSEVFGAITWSNNIYEPTQIFFKLSEFDFPIVFASCHDRNCFILLIIVSIAKRPDTIHQQQIRMCVIHLRQVLRCLRIFYIFGQIQQLNAIDCSTSNL